MVFVEQHYGTDKRTKKDSYKHAQLILSKEEKQFNGGEIPYSTNNAKTSGDS